jgi:hypothetical protein
VCADRVADLARLCAAGFADRLYDDVRRWKGACLFGQATAEGLHELVVHFLAAELGEQTPHLRNIFFVTPPLFGTLLQHGGAARQPARA